MNDETERVSYDAWLRRNPPHPGGGIRDCMEGLSVGAAAKKLGIATVTLSRVLNGHSSITPALAVKLEAVGWSTARAWLSLQMTYDLAKERNRTGIWPADPDLPGAEAA